MIYFKYGNHFVKIENLSNFLSNLSHSGKFQEKKTLIIPYRKNYLGINTHKHFFVGAMYSLRIPPSL